MEIPNSYLDAALHAADVRGYNNVQGMSPAEEDAAARAWQDKLDDVDEHEVMDILSDTNEIGMLCLAIAGDLEDDIQSMVRILKLKAVEIREQLARKA